MNSYESLLARIALVRRRWRAQAAVKGISLFLAATIALLILCVWGADAFGFRPAAVWMMRALSAAVILFIAWRFLYLPLSVRLRDVQIAQFIEEKHPQLEDRLVAAVEYGKKDREAAGLIDLLIKDALEKSSRIDYSIFVKPKRLAGYGLLGAAAFAALFSLLTWGPSFFRFGFNRLYAPWTQASLNAPIMIRIKPGDVEIAKGADQQVQAELVGFDSPDVRLFLKPESSNVWSSSTMAPDLRGVFRYLLIDIRSSLQYYVESKGVRSRAYSMKVVDLAAAERVDLTYRFPSYTKMAPQVVEDEGDISALKGTDVDLRIRLSRPARAARLLFDDQSTLNLTLSGARDFSGSLSLRRSGSYVIQIAGDNGKHYPGSREYRMEALGDGAPEVVIAKPMRDVRATSVEEVFSETKADDDIGVNKLELHYSVNGGPEKTATLFNGKPPQKSVVRAHTFFLEEFGLQPGDIVSYYAKAWDNNDVTRPGTASSDIYFIEVRPFEQIYKQSQQAGMQGQQGERQEDENQDGLSRQQKEIISGTFNLIRKKEETPEKELQDGLKTLALVQSRLQTQAQNVVDRLQRRGADQAGENFRKMSEHLKNAIVEMGKAAADLGAQKPNEALPQEQKSLQQLMRAESLFREIQVSFSQSAGSGSQSSRANAEDLADLFELEMNKLKNQYETVQSGERQERDQKIDETLQRLKELAQRQQQLNERSQRMAQRGGSPPNSSGAGGQGQQQLMEQAEQLRRQLQKLSRERSNPQLSETGDQLQKAIDEMKKALDGAQRGSQSEANAQGARALQQLNDAARKLARSQQSGLNEGVERAADESKKLVKEQSRIQEEIDRLAANKAQSGGLSEEMKRRGEEVVDRKSNLSDRLKNLDSQIQELSRQARRTQREASDKLDDAADIIRENRLPERIESGNASIQNGLYESQQGREEFIRDGLEDLSRQLESASSSIGQSKEGKLEDAANRARNLAEGLEAMQQRMRSMQQGRRGQQGQQGQQAQQGSQGQRGQPDSQGQRGQQGQQAQQGSQGQRGQPDSQGQQGQQGQRGQQAQQGSQGQRGQQGQQGRQGQPGQQGQQGDQQAQGQGRQGGMQGQERNAEMRGANPANLRGGFPSPDGEIQGLTGDSMGSAGPGRRDDEDARQLGSEWRRRLADAQELRRLLDRDSTEMGNMEKVIDSLRRAGDYTDYDDPEQIGRLKAAIDYTRKVESGLHRDLERLNQTEKYFLAEDNEAPADYRKLVEEYYKAIAKSR